MHLVSYNSHVLNKIQQYRMVKSRAAPPKWLFHVVTWSEKDRYTLIEQSAHRSC